MEPAGWRDVGRARAGVRRAVARDARCCFARQVGDAADCVARRHRGASIAVVGIAAAQVATRAAAVSDVAAIGRAIGAATFAVESEEVRERADAAVSAVGRCYAADGRRQRHDREDGKRSAERASWMGVYRHGACGEAMEIRRAAQWAPKLSQSSIVRRGAETSA